MAAPSSRSALVDAALRRHPELDRDAVMRVFRQEGLSGGIGDGGHAFGPAQLNNAGGVITGRFRGQTPEQINQWAWSPQGIEYALQGISRVAGGQHGAQAVNSIVRRFERPADPNGEVARALGGSAGPGGPPGLSAIVGGPTIGTSAPDSRRQFAQQLLSAISPTGQLDNGGLLGALQTRMSVMPAAWGTPDSPKLPGRPPASPMNPPSRPLKLASIDGVQVDSRIADQLQSVLTRFGVHPTSGYRDPAHNRAVGGAQRSDHLSGDAVDFGGSPQQLAALYAYAQGRYPYVEPMAQAKNHVHISFARNGR